MAKKLIIKNKNNEELQSVIFEDQKSIDDFKEVLKKGKSWGEEGDYSLEEIDVTQELVLEKTKRETKKIDRLDRIDKLKAIDWTKVTTIADIKAIVKILTKEIIKDDE